MPFIANSRKWVGHINVSRHMQKPSIGVGQEEFTPAKVRAWNCFKSDGYFANFEIASKILLAYLGKYTIEEKLT